MSAIWRISLSNLSRNLLEATELANVLQEVSSSIQVTGLSSSHSARTSSSASGSLTTISTRERIKSALPLHICAASFPWEQLVGVVSSEALQDPPYSADKQPQLVEVNTGGSVFFLFFKLTREQYLQQLHLLQERQQQDQQQQQQISEQPGGDGNFDAEASTSSSNGRTSPAVAATEGGAGPAAAPADPKAAAALEELALVVAHNRTSSGSIAAADVILPKAPLIATIASSNGPYVREGVAVLKVGFNRLAMQAEQFANELTRHLGIAAPDCRIVRQVGCTADEWNAAMAAVNYLANCCDNSAEAATKEAVSAGGASSVSSGGCGGCAGCLTSGDAGELLAELSHLPCFLLMEYVEGDRMADCSQTMEGDNLGVLLEDVGCLFLLDMLLGNADRMPCKRLGWRGNKNNLLYGAPGTRHANRPVAIDSCVARRPPAQKASAEDAAVEQLAQLLLSVPEVSRSLLQQLLGDIKRHRRRRVSRKASHRLSSCGRSPVDSNNRCAPTTTATGPAGLQHSSGGGSLPASVAPVHQQQEQQKCRTATEAFDAAAIVEGGDLDFTDRDIARFQAGLRKCLNGVTQIKGLLEMVSTKTAEWIAEFVADVVCLNPAVLPSPGPTPSGTPGSGVPPFSPLRSPRPSPRPSMRSSLSNIIHGSAAASLRDNISSSEPGRQEHQQGSEDTTQGGGINHSSSKNSSSVLGCSAVGGAQSGHMHSSADAPQHSSGASLPPCAPLMVASPAGSMPPDAPLGLAAAAADIDAAQSSSLSPVATTATRSSSGNSSTSAEVYGASSPGMSGGERVKGSSPGKPGLAVRRGHLGFASIRAAIDSKPFHSTIAISPSTNSSGTPQASSPTDVSGSSAPSYNVVETAVAAALSPRATKAQTQALVGVFGGGSVAGSDGGIRFSFGGSKPHPRRVTWGSVGEGDRAAKFFPRELFPESSPILEDQSAAHSHDLRASSATSILDPQHSHHVHHHPHGNSHTSSSSLMISPHSISSGGPGGTYSSLCVTAPQRSGSGPPSGRELFRHMSFPAQSGITPAAVATAPAVYGPPSSSVQVLASIQLDATLASIKYEARHDGALAERMAHWKAVFREKGAELSDAIGQWQARHHLAAVLSTGFLDGSHPIVDVYELGVRLQHMLRRLTALAAGALVQAPICVLPRVFLGNAVAADSHHLLQYLGVTHVVNAAQELQVEVAPGLFHMYRVGIRDEEEEDISRHFYSVTTWIDSALSAGGAVLVHCHEGKSRSVALLLAYLMIDKGHTLKAAMEHIKAVRPEASPNAGFMNQLMTLDLELHGAASMCRKELPRAKPEARVCSICGKATGVSSKSLDMHIKRVHGKPSSEGAEEGQAVA